mgnify:CR=1 FL=1
MSEKRFESKGRKRGMALACALLTGLCALPHAEAASSWKDSLAVGEKDLQSEVPERAVASFRQALVLVKKEGGSQEDIDRCMLKLASALALTQHPGEARDMARKVLLRRTNKYGSGSPRLSPVLMNLGSIEESAGDHARAMSYYNQALKITEKSYGPYSPEAAGALVGLGHAHGKLGNKDEALNHYKRAMTILSRDPNLDAARQLQRVQHAYGDLLKGTDQSSSELIKDFDREILDQSSKDTGDDASRVPLRPPIRSSEWQKQSSIELQSKHEQQTDENEQVSLRGISMPGSDRSLAPAFRVVNDAVLKQDRFAAGAEQYKRKIAIDIDALGPHHPSVGNDLAGLGQLYITEGRYDKARPLLERALAVYHDAYGDGNLLTINARAMLASCQFHLGNGDRAAGLYREALAQAQKSLGPDSMDTARILNELAYLYYHQGQLEQSRTFYEWAVASTERAAGENNPLLAACLKDYAQVLRRLGRNDRALEVESRAGKILSSSN